ncbi:MAG TPA: PIN domain-containing protein [Herpetosiphonaceae bacterium]
MSSVISHTSVFIDTNVWLYAFIAGQDLTKTQRANRLISTTTTIVVSTQVINEVCVNLIKREKFSEAQIRDVINDFYHSYGVVGLDQPVLLLASALRDRYALSFWDGLIVACAVTSGADHLYSEDMQDGLNIDGALTIINPFKHP